MDLWRGPADSSLDVENRNTRLAGARETASAKDFNRQRV